MLSRVWSCAFVGVEALPVSIETHTERALPSFQLVGLPSSTVKESRARVLSAIRNASFEVPSGRITVNLAPAYLPKEGSAFDLPLAVGLLLAEQVTAGIDADRVLLLGELSLDGTVRPVRGVLPAGVAASRHGYRRLLVPEANASEAAVVDGIDIYPVRTLRDSVEILQGSAVWCPVKVDVGSLFRSRSERSPDLFDVKGQNGVKRALEVAAAGGHNLLMVGPPGSGKTMLARRLPGILPRLSMAESLETTAIHSVGGTLRTGLSLIVEPPFRAPHHTVSDAGLVGGGANPMPGEISLAHNGVLFLDEFPEFRRTALEVLRQPLEEGYVSIVRARASVDFPARFMLVASMNPCPCGYLTTTDRECMCSAGDIQRYRSRLSGPVLDRIDLHIEVEPVSFESMEARGRGESSADVLSRVLEARDRQQSRFASSPSVRYNARMELRHLRKYCRLDEPSRRLLRSAVRRLALSGRGFHRVLKIARTIADLDGSESLTARAVAEAIQYRSLDRNFWNR
jgi:magnesium chelatase family protein